MSSVNSDLIKMDNVLTANALFGDEASTLDMLEVPELGGVVYLRQLSAREMMMMSELRREDENDPSTIRAQNVAMAKALVDADGGRIVPEGEEDRLGDMPMKAYMRIIKAITADITSPDSEVDAETTEAPDPGGRAEGNALS